MKGRGTTRKKALVTTLAIVALLAIALVAGRAAAAVTPQAKTPTPSSGGR